jgi:RNA recognition motif-containing protein
MARNKNRSFNKRKREQERRERAAQKLARRRARGVSAGDPGGGADDPIVEEPQHCDKPSQEEVRLAVERAMSPPTKSARQGRRPSFGSRLFVGNLDAMAQEHDLCALFTKAGFEVTDAFIPRDRVTGEPRGIAFVELADARDAKRAIEAFDGMTFHSKELRVNAANQARGR